MKRSFLVSIACASFCMTDAGLGAQGPEWIVAFDNTGRLPDGLVDHRINFEVLTMPILGLRFYRVDGSGSYVELDPYLGIGSTLQDHFDQPWTPVGFETDNYKQLSINTGSRLSTIYIADDHDIVNPEGGPFIRQTQYSGTPDGIITSGYTTAGNFWLDHGIATYQLDPTFGSVVYRLDVLAVVPEPSTLTMLGLGVVLGLMMMKRWRCSFRCMQPTSSLSVLGSDSELRERGRKRVTA